MAKKISELPKITSTQNTDSLLVSTGGGVKRRPMSDFTAPMASSLKEEYFNPPANVGALLNGILANATRIGSVCWTMTTSDWSAHVNDADYTLGGSASVCFLLIAGSGNFRTYLCCQAGNASKLHILSYANGTWQCRQITSTSTI